MISNDGESLKTFRRSCSQSYSRAALEKFMVGASAEQALLGQADLAVYSARGQLQLVVVVKSRPGAPAKWAAQMRRNLVVNFDIPDAPYFLLALPDHFYLWHEAPIQDASVLPDYDADPAPLLSSYLGDDARLSTNLTDYSLLLAVSTWLRHVAGSELSQQDTAVGGSWLFDSGLYDAIHGGTVLL
jgi:hypothetical protein